MITEKKLQEKRARKAEKRKLPGRLRQTRPDSPKGDKTKRPTTIEARSTIPWWMRK